jgi:hypothetical protein
MDDDRTIHADVLEKRAVVVVKAARHDTALATMASISDAVARIA